MTTTCQICGRAILANTGTIALHGYKRPGHGWQTASCFGAKFRPYEVACDALPIAIEAVQRYLAVREKALKTWTKAPPDFITYHRKDAYGSLIGSSVQLHRPDHFSTKTRPGSTIPRTYDSLYWSQHFELTSSISRARDEEKYMVNRLAAWRAPA